METVSVPCPDSIAATKLVLRKDAARNRAALINAASHCMRTEGGDVPMEVIAERAGVTRGTLYRNFPHRRAMYQAVLEHDLVILAEKIARDEADNPLAFITLTAEMMMVYEKFLHVLSRSPELETAEAQPRIVATIERPLRRAQELGMIRSDLDGSDILMACRMLASHVRLDRQANDAAGFRERFDMLMRGLAA